MKRDVIKHASLIVFASAASAIAAKHASIIVFAGAAATIAAIYFWRRRKQRTKESEHAGADAAEVSYDHPETAREACVEGCKLSVDVAAEVLDRAELLQLLTERYMTENGDANIYFSRVHNVVNDLARRLEAKPPSRNELFEVFLNLDTSATNRLTLAELRKLLYHQIRCHLQGGAFNTSIESETQRGEFDGIDSVGQIKVSVATLGGVSFDLDVDDTDKSLNLKVLIESTQGVKVSEQRLVFQGLVLQDHLALHDMGVFDGAVLYLVRISKLPQKARLLPPEIEPQGDFEFLCIQVVCCEYSLTELRKDGRPVYRSGFSKYLYYQEARERWVIADRSDWAAYGDNAWAFCASDGDHPGLLSGFTWHVCDNTYRKFHECACYLEVTME